MKNADAANIANIVIQNINILPTSSKYIDMP